MSGEGGEGEGGGNVLIVYVFLGKAIFSKIPGSYISPSITVN